MPARWARGRVPEPQSSLQTRNRFFSCPPISPESLVVSRRLGPPQRAPRAQRGGVRVMTVRHSFFSLSPFAKVPRGAYPMAPGRAAEPRSSRKTRNLVFLSCPPNSPWCPSRGSCTCGRLPGFPGPNALLTTRLSRCAPDAPCGVPSMPPVDPPCRLGREDQSVCGRTGMCTSNRFRNQGVKGPSQKAARASPSACQPSCFASHCSSRARASSKFEAL